MSNQHQFNQLWPTSSFLSSNPPTIGCQSVSTNATSTEQQQLHHQCSTHSADSIYASDEDTNDSDETVDCDAMRKLVGDLLDSNSNPTTPKDECPPLNGFHEEINRTASETLSQEYLEWQTSKVAEPNLLDFASITTNSELWSNSSTIEEPEQEKDDFLDEDDSSSDDEQDPSEPAVFDESALKDPKIEALYKIKLEKAIKLGYTEEVVRQAIAKLGFEANQNDLLGEYIRLGSGGTFIDEKRRIIVKPRQKYTEPELCSSLKQLSLATLSTAQLPLRPIVVDGSNVAVSHGNGEFFSCRGIKICIDWFRVRGHREITAFVPMWRKQQQQTSRFTDLATRDREILLELESERVLSFTPSRNVSGRLLACYDDRYILNLAVKNEGIIVSNDNYRDLCNENGDYRRAVEERLLMYTFVGDEFMPPDDPFGRGGPHLTEFLHMPDPNAAKCFNHPCPYERKCTYGNKCKYYHPDRSLLPHKPVAELLTEQAQKSLMDSKLLNTVAQPVTGTRNQKSKIKHQTSLPLTGMSVTTCFDIQPATTFKTKKPLSRTKSIAVDSLTVAPSILSIDSNLSAANPAIPPNSANHSPTRNPPSKHPSHPKLVRQLTLNPNSDSRLPQSHPKHSLLTTPTSSSSSLIGSNSNLASSAENSPHRNKGKLSQTKSWGNSNVITSSASFDSESMQSLKKSSFSKSSRTINDHQSSLHFPSATPPPPKMMVNDVSVPGTPATPNFPTSLPIGANPFPTPGHYPPSVMQPFIQLPFPHPLLQQQEYQQYNRMMMSRINVGTNAAAIFAAATVATIQQQQNQNQQPFQRKSLQQSNQHKHNQAHHHKLQQSLSSSSINRNNHNSNSRFTHQSSSLTNSTSSIHSLSNNSSQHSSSSSIGSQATAKHQHKPPKGVFPNCPKTNPNIVPQHSLVTRNRSAPETVAVAASSSASSVPSHAKSHNAISASSTDATSSLACPPQAPVANLTSSPNSLHQGTTSLSSCSSSFVSTQTGNQEHQLDQQSLTMNSCFGLPGCSASSANVWSYDQPVLDNSWAQLMQPTDSSASIAEKREKIFFHLSAIFPKEQVEKAMQQLPYETDPQVICSAIASMQPKI